MCRDEFWYFLRYVMLFAIIFALLGGVNVNGKHYEVSCGKTDAGATP